MLMPTTILLAVLVPFVAALLLVPIVRAIALRLDWVDKPDGERKLHALPTANVGGVAIAASFLIGLVSVGLLFSATFDAATVMVVAGALIILATGLYDDIYTLGFKKKFLIQAFVAYLLLHAGYRFEVSHLPFMPDDPFQQALFSIPITMLWIIGILNAINLLDGLDGLAAGVSLIAFASLSAISGLSGHFDLTVITLLMAGSLLAFLVYNFNKASIFMGDSGSLFLGYMLIIGTLSVGLELQTKPVLAFIVPVFALALPLLDTALCIIRRMTAGKSPFMPDSDHLHHRIARISSPRRAVLIMYGAATWFGVGAVLIAIVKPLIALLITSLTLLMVYVTLRLLDKLESRGDKEIEHAISLEDEVDFQRETAGNSASISTEQHSPRRKPFRLKGLSDDLAIEGS